MAWESGVAAAGIGAASSALGAYFANKEAKKSFKRQLQAQEDFARKSPTWTRAGLKAAGYNPILGIASPASFSMPQAPNIRSVGEGVAGALQAGVNSGLAARRANAELELLESQNVKTREEAHAAKGAGWNQHFQSKINQQMLTVAEAEAASAKALKNYLTTPTGQRLEQWKRAREQIFGGSGRPSIKGGKR